MAFQYEVFEVSLYRKEVGKYLSYGIRLYKISAKKKVLLEEYEDAFLDLKTALEFATLCNEEAVSPVHFYDVLEDFLP